MTKEPEPSAPAPPEPGAPPPSPAWIDGLPRRPLCDVPWLGRSVILSDGAVNFCCFSDATVGNVHDQPLQKIWRGPKMRAIRESLVRQRLPPQCESTSCPIYRGDAHTYLIERMDGWFRRERTGTDDPQAAQRARLQASRLDVSSPRIGRGEAIEVRASLECSRDRVIADLFVCVTFPDRRLRFLPDLTEYPLPLARRLELAPWLGTVVLECLHRTNDRSLPRGAYEMCAGLFALNSNPALLSNCYWTTRVSFELA